MAESNPYQTPRSAVGAPAEQYGEIRLISFSGRLGRLRYIAYSFALSIILGLVAAALGWLLDGRVGAAGIEGTASYYLSIVFGCLMLWLFAGWMVQRLHDFNASAWWVLLALVPLANIVIAIVLWVKAGTPGTNQFGHPPPPNTTGVNMLAFAAIALIALGFAVVLLFFGLRLFVLVPLE